MCSVDGKVKHICRQLFAGHVAGKMHRMIIYLIDHVVDNLFISANNTANNILFMSN